MDTVELDALRAENQELRTRVAELEREFVDARKAQEEHTHLAATLEGILHAVPDLFFQLRSDGTIVRSISRYATDFYVPPEEFLGKRMQEVLPEPLNGAITEVLHDVGTSREMRKLEYALPRKDGSDAWYEARLIPLEQEDVIVVVRDMTAHRHDKEELRLLNAELEERVRERTEELKAETEHRLALKRQIIESQQAALRAISTPLVPIARNVVAVPLIGEIGPERSAQLLETILTGIQARGAAIVLLDVTGVPSIDESAAEAMARVARAVSLLGAELILTGIGPQVAQALVSVGVDLSGIRTTRSLEQGIAQAISRDRTRLSPPRA
ncbi:STAS domain-containing protein [Chondromyces crocatus]|uniref:STAS domain-containing protein n=1 Tax=Chondromyces crocatus TaxID=52 RepID=A0A0K1ER62_CHOCO|nr:STAS domain-containing protein [Chondromyces crocatus]AKT43088.1 uncharacterized protein CMC5_073160 [Chondromyces crocatus]